MRILIVDDEPALRHTISTILREEGHEVTTASHGEEALAALATSPADLVLCDVRMPVMDGMTFVERFTASGNGSLVVMMSAYGDADTAIAAMQRGAYDWIQKPFRAEEIILVVRKAMEREKLRQHVRRLEEELSSLRNAKESIVGASASMRAAIDVARKVAPHPSTVLITGESGTGKELVARLIHQESPRATGPFVAVNCGAIPEALLESELFGHEKGAFTSASRDKAGLFEEAHEGTLFLDEIGELPVALQVKLLRALQEGEVRRVGATTSRPVDVRVVTATNRDLQADVASGRFRADLFYRINVVVIDLPPLRSRPEDVPDLVHHFIARAATRLGMPTAGISPAAMRVLAEHSWPGNVRELENAIERALVLCEGSRIEVGHLSQLAAPRDDAAASDTLSIKLRTSELEKTLIQRALERTRGNRTHAARLLDLSHRALLYKIRAYGLE
ncbi:MAG: sigma-54-dependent transcriptional regulator [Gemmatimonadaceae bacterium]